ncbi:MAG: C4-type zinc ribbon domain-containing protein [Deltaproteobacteria bacterium]|nr:C4-type zinc ribbon domain-containing protein [Deltaproteobacteria bacterium]
MKNDLTQLITLSKIDSTIDLLEDRKGELPEAIRSLETQLSDLLGSLEAQKKNMETMKGELKKKEGDLTEQKEWAVKREERAKEIKTNKEYHAALKEVAQSKKACADLEAAITSLNTRIEEEGVKIAEVEGTLADRKQALENEISEKKGEIANLDAEIAEQVTERTGKEKELKEGLLKKYKTIRNRIAPALAGASQGTCMECNTRIPPQMYIELQKYKQIVNCPRCHRILYVEAEIENVTTAP